MLTIQLGSVKKKSTDKEWRMVPFASCEGIDSVGDGANLAALCRALIEAGHERDTLAEVKRGDMPVFAAAPIWRWAEGKLSDREQPAHLRRS